MGPVRRLRRDGILAHAFLATIGKGRKFVFFPKRRRDKEACRSVSATPRRCEMNAGGFRPGQGRPAKRVPSVIRCDPQGPPGAQIAKPRQLQTPKPQPRNGATIFGPETLLARTGSSRKTLNLKRNEWAYAQGDPADAIFYVQKGQLRVTGRTWDFLYTPTTHLTGQDSSQPSARTGNLFFFRRDKKSCRSVAAPEV
jgi:hypothetical protein